MNEATERKAQGIDRHIGQKIRLRRCEKGFSQVDLGSVLGLSWQQVQKYERAQNRVSASRLYLIASTLKTPVAWFYDGFGAEGGLETLCGRDALETQNLLRTYFSLDRKARMECLRLIRRVSAVMRQTEEAEAQGE